MYHLPERRLVRYLHRSRRERGQEGEAKLAFYQQQGPTRLAKSGSVKDGFHMIFKEGIRKRKRAW